MPSLPQYESQVDQYLCELDSYFDAPAVVRTAFGDYLQVFRLEARASKALARLLDAVIRRMQAADALLSIADRVAEAGISPMSMDEINAEVKAARANRRTRLTPCSP
jgi:hypothetical protein